jgi:hypothetical protein
MKIDALPPADHLVCFEHAREAGLKRGLAPDAAERYAEKEIKNYLEYLRGLPFPDVGVYLKWLEKHPGQTPGSAAHA